MVGRFRTSGDFITSSLEKGYLAITDRLPGIMRQPVQAESTFYAAYKNLKSIEID
jgi:hypothetical protein